jgi:hypothetical protein
MVDSSLTSEPCKDVSACGLLQPVLMQSIKGAPVVEAVGKE